MPVHVKDPTVKWRVSLNIGAKIFSPGQDTTLYVLNLPSFENGLRGMRLNVLLST
jgi:hypothetical protein